MAKAYMPFSAQALHPASGVASNLSAVLDYKDSTSGTDPKSRYPRWLFADNAVQYVHLSFVLPDDYDHNTAPHLKLFTGHDEPNYTVRFEVYVAATTPGEGIWQNTVDSVNQKDQELNGAGSTTIDITLTNEDGARAGDLIDIIVGRDAVDAANTYQHGLWVIGGVFEYTKT